MRWLQHLSFLVMTILGTACLELKINSDATTSSSSGAGMAGMAGMGGMGGSDGMAGMGGMGGSAGSGCPAEPLPDVVYVHGLIGNDESATGECDKPFKSITKGLAQAKKTKKLSGASFITLHVAGATYEAGINSTGETFPLVLDIIGLTLEGEGRDQVLIKGAGNCDPMAGVLRCRAVELTGQGTNIKGVHIQTTNGHGIYTESPDFQVEKARISSTAMLNHPGENGDGIHFAEMFDVFKAVLDDVEIQYNRLHGINVEGFKDRNITLNECKISNNEDDGLRFEGNGTLTSTKNSFYSNGDIGVHITHSVVFNSTNDKFFLNKTGLQVGTNGSEKPKTTLTEALIEQNWSHGIRLIAALSPNGFKMRKSIVLRNPTGIRTALNDDKVDLGRLLDEGFNTLQSSVVTEKNTQTALCFTGTGTLSAHGNIWSACPPTSDSTGTCTGGHDYSIKKDANMMPMGTIDVGMCSSMACVSPIQQ